MINLWYGEHYYSSSAPMCGPVKLFQNLKDSLDECQIPYSVNKEIYDKNFIRDYGESEYKIHENLEHNSCFIGPQFWPFDVYGKFLVDNPDYYNKLITPSQWVKDLLLVKFGVNEHKVAVWPVGIKTLNFDRNIKYDCLIYFKRRSTEEFNKAIDFIKSKNLSYNIISYGSYSENDFQLISSQSKFCFLVNGTESQGIAVQEMMSCNLPLFVWDVAEWNDQGKQYQVPATSVPYWDETCGERFFLENEMEETFSKFYDKISSYKPKEFVEKNLSYKRSVEILMEILNVN